MILSIILRRLEYKSNSTQGGLATISTIKRKKKNPCSPNLSHNKLEGASKKNSDKTGLGNNLIHVSG